MFDFDNDGMLSRVEVFNLADICIRIQIQFASFSSSNKLRSGSVYTESPDIVNDIMNQHDPDHVRFTVLNQLIGKTLIGNYIFVFLLVCLNQV